MSSDKICTKGLILGKKQIYLPVCQSTNLQLSQLVREQSLPEGALLWTDEQTAGRGQRGNTWESEPNQNLTFSFLLQPHFLKASDAFWLTMVVALGIWDALRLLTAHQYPNLLDDWKIKWTNDIYIHHQKIGGILIENMLNGNHIAQAIVGVGLNINQMVFDASLLQRAISLKQLTNQEWSKEKVLTELLDGIEQRYLQLRDGMQNKLRLDYTNALYRYQEWQLFKISRAHNKASHHDKVLGQVLGVDNQGRLAVEINNQVRYFNHQEIEFVFL